MVWITGSKSISEMLFAAANRKAIDPRNRAHAHLAHSGVLFLFALSRYEEIVRLCSLFLGLLIPKVPSEARARLSA